MDETWIGGKPRKGNGGDNKPKRGRGIKKPPVIGAIERGGKTAYGYEATILADICDAVTSAQRAGGLLKQQRHIAEQCDVLMRGFARIGIINGSRLTSAIRSSRNIWHP